MNCHFIHDKIQDDLVKIQYVYSANDHFTDIFTKQIEKEAFSINHDVQVGRS